MARPRSLQTKGPFSVLDFGHGDFRLVFRGRVVSVGSRHRLYRERALYSSWLSCICSLLYSTGAKPEDFL